MYHAIQVFFSTKERDILEKNQYIPLLKYDNEINTD